MISIGLAKVLNQSILELIRKKEPKVSSLSDFDTLLLIISVRRTQLRGHFMPCETD